MNEFIVAGPPLPNNIPTTSLGEQIYESLKSKSDCRLPALINESTKEEISYQELYDSTIKTATWLRYIGIKPQQVIVVCAENSVHFFKPVIGGLLNGSIISTINPASSVYELQHMLNIIKPSIIFCSEIAHAKFMSLDRKKIHAKKIIVLEKLYTYIDKVKVKEDFTPAKIDKDETALVLFSSGTTGFPKGVMLTHWNITVRNIQSRDPRCAMFPNDPAFLIVPFYHAYAFMVTYGRLSSSDPSTVIFLNKFEPELYLRTIQKHKIKHLLLVPPIAVFLSKTPLLEKYDISHVCEIFCGAAPLSKEVEDSLRAKLPNLIHVRQAYGMTETVLAITLFYNDSEDRSGSVGQVAQGTFLKIRDPETGKSLGPYQAGEVCVKSPLLMKGYYNDPEATKNAIRDGWYFTGDVAYYDNDEYFYIVDRLKELIKYKAYQVAPAELEALLLKHPDIEDAGVVGLPDESAGELPFAFIVKQPNSNIIEIDIQNYVKNLASDAKRLRGGVRFVDAIPKNPSGKILRKELREMLHIPKSKL